VFDPPALATLQPATHPFSSDPHMNSNIIPLGATEFLTDGTITAADPILLIEAITDLVCTNATPLFPKLAAGRGTVATAFTLKQGGHLFNLKTITYTGTAAIIYRD
jgi:hypothetical protein